MSLTLYYHPLSSYCQKALVALYENGTAFEKRLIDLSDAAQRSELLAIWPLGKFPVLRDQPRGRDVAESSIVIEYLDRVHPGERQLIPVAPEAALAVRFWDRVCDLHLHNPMQDIVADEIQQTKRDMSRARGSIQTVYRLLDKQLQGQGWLAGGDFSLADCAAAPALFYASTLELIPPGCPALQAYFERLMQRPSVQRVLAEARPYFSMYPFHRAIPARFL